MSFLGFAVAVTSSDITGAPERHSRRLEVPKRDSKRHKQRAKEEVAPVAKRTEKSQSCLRLHMQGPSHVE
jgi:hypothetical protein